MNVDAILNYAEDPNEDYYSLLGCDSSSTTEQIIAEFKIRAKEFHPDKQGGENQDKFQLLLEAKNTLVDQESRSLYDSWKSSGIALSYKQWRALKDSVRTSMHWATPKTAGRMLQSEQLLTHSANDPISLQPSPVKESTATSKMTEDEPDNQETDDEIVYTPTPYDKLGVCLETPPPELEIENEGLTGNQSKQKIALKSKSLSRDSVDDPTKNLKIKPKEDDSKIAMRRKLFAVRRESTIGTMVMAEKLDDNEIRRRFRNYEI